MEFNLNKILIILILVIIVLVGFSYYLINYFQKLSLSKVSIEKEQEDLCFGFTKIEGEINCEEAIKIAQKEYSGDIKYINRSEIPMLVGILPEAEELEQKVWLIGINLAEPIQAELGEEVGEVKSIELLIYRDTGKFEPHLMMNEEIKNQAE